MITRFDGRFTCCSDDSECYFSDFNDFVNIDDIGDFNDFDDFNDFFKSNNSDNNASEGYIDDNI